MSCEEQGPVAATSCDPCGPAIRNRWFRGKLVTAADYEIEQRYLIHRRRMITQSTTGYGIASGFEVEPAEGGIAIAPGVAFDCHGRELFACERVCLDEGGDVVWLDKGKCGLGPVEGERKAGKYVLSAHYAERDVDGVRVGSDCGEDSCVASHTCETVIYSLRPVATGNIPLPRVPCDKIEPTAKAKPQEVKYDPVLARNDGVWGLPGLCTCGQCYGDDRHCDPCCEPKLARWRKYRLDCDAGVPLAIVTVELVGTDACKKLAFCTVIQVVHACRLTRIQDVGWRNWHERPDIVVSRANFGRMFVDPPVDKRQQTQSEDDYYDEEEEDGAGTDKRPKKFPPVATRFWVCFSAPVQTASITRDVVSMTLVQPDSREAIGNVVEVPIVGVWCRKTLEHDPAGTTRGFYFFVQYQFWQGEIRSGSSSGFRRETQVVLRVDGNSIVDWKGRAVDGDSLGRKLPSGNGMQGGVMLSSWRVRHNGDDTPPYGAIPGEADTKQSSQPADRDQAAQAAS